MHKGTFSTMSKRTLVRQASEYPLESGSVDLFEEDGPVSHSLPNHESVDSACEENAEAADVEPIDVDEAVKYLTAYLATDATMFQEELKDLDDVAFSISQTFQVTPCKDVATFAIMKQIRVDQLESFNALEDVDKLSILYVAVCRLCSYLEKANS